MVLINKLGLCVVILLLLFQQRLAGQNTGSIAGIVVNKTTQSPIEFASIQLINTNYGCTTDSLGNFKITNIPVGTYNLMSSMIGFKPTELFNLNISSGNENTYIIELEEDVNTLQEVVIKGNTRTVKSATIETPLSTQRITTEEIRSNPGGNFDISKVIQTLPGVGGGANGGSFRNDIIIRGGAPNENVFYLDGIEVPVINHFQTQGSSGGPQGMLNISFIEDVKLNSSAFDAKYDNAVSSVFQFRQKKGNRDHVQGNIRLSASELASTMEGPLAKNGKTTFLASARRSYLQFLFKALDLPIRPDYWDFQTKIIHQINEKTTLSFIGLGAIDLFSFAPTRKSTPENTYILNSNPIIHQWNYTGGFSLKKSLDNGYWELTLSRTHFNNNIIKYLQNNKPSSDEITYHVVSNEIENKLRWNVTKSFLQWKLSYGLSAQWATYNNETYNLISNEIINSSGQLIVPRTEYRFRSPLEHLSKFGAYYQVGRRFLNDRIGLSVGIRSDINSFTKDGLNPFNTISPRLSFTYSISNPWVFNFSIGRYFKIPPYTILGYADNQNNLVNQSSKYLSSNHFVTGFEYIPREDIRFTIEGFLKTYQHVPVSIRNEIPLSNLGADFSILGNEPVKTDGFGRTYGLEVFFQKKLTDKAFGIVSYTYYKSEYTSEINRPYTPSSWDNRHLLSATIGYKFPHNWELGLKFRYQGGAPYTPFDETASRSNYLLLGVGTLDYDRINSLRLNSFNSSDIRIDKKWNFKKTSLDFFLDVTNWYVAKNPRIPEYTFLRNEDNSGFKTLDNKPIQLDGSNAIPTRVKNDDAIFTPSFGFIYEF